MVADRQRTGENTESASGAVAARRRQSGHRSSARVAARERIKNRLQGLRSGFSFWHTGSKCQSSGDIEAEQLQPKTSSSSGSSSRRILRLSRRKLSAKLCEAWDWKQANGALRDMVCRGLLLMLHRAGEIELPAVRQVSLNPFVQRDKPQPVLDRHDAADRRACRPPPDLSCNRSEEHPTSRCSTASSNNIITSAMSSPWANT